MEEGDGERGNGTLVGVRVCDGVFWAYDLEGVPKIWLIISPSGTIWDAV